MYRVSGEEEEGESVASWLCDKVRRIDGANYDWNSVMAIGDFLRIDIAWWGWIAYDHLW